MTLKCGIEQCGRENENLKRYKNIAKVTALSKHHIMEAHTE